MLLVQLLDLVFSTYVEMILLVGPMAMIAAGILHVCGDDPQHEAF